MQTNPKKHHCHIILPTANVRLLSLPVVGQEFLLFSWKLVLCDVIIAIYVLSVSLFVLLLSADINSNVVISALLTCVPWSSTTYPHHLSWTHLAHADPL
jgi:hypothetical protein